MDAVITTLYLANSAVALIGYLPQCWSLWRMLKTDRVNKSVSLASWFLWSWAYGITCIYALVISPQDRPFVMVSSVNAAFCLLTFLLVLRVRFRIAKKLREGLL